MSFNAALSSALSKSSAVTAGFDLQAAQRNAATTRLKQNAEVRNKIGEVAGSVFLEPVLRSMSENPFKAEFLDGGQAGKAFEAQLAQELAGRVGKSLGDSFARHLSMAVQERVASSGLAG